MKELDTGMVADWANEVRAGQEILLSGVVYTARDAVHKKLHALIQQKKALPFSLENAVLYYAGATPARDGMPIGSCGPTTSSRMDSYTPELLSLGIKGMIGKGERSAAVRDTIQKNHAVYLCAIGGAGALAAQCIREAEEIAFPELGCESVKRLVFYRFPLFVGVDSQGGNLLSR